MHDQKPIIVYFIIEFVCPTENTTVVWVTSGGSGVPLKTPFISG